MKDYISLSVPQSSVCNLDCVYCYIPKDKTLGQIHKNWASRFSDGSYLEVLSETFDRGSLESLSLWGGEPSIGYKDLKKISDLFRQFPRLRGLTTSSNMSEAGPHRLLIENLQKISEQRGALVAYDLQISVDGDQETTNRNRGEGLYQRIQANLKSLVEVARENPGVKLNIHTKATNTDSDYRRFIEDPNELRKFIESFIFLEKEYVDSIDWPENVSIHLFTLPTLALPGSYTKADGEVFYKYHVLLEEIVKEYPGATSVDVYSRRIQELIDQESLLNKGFINRNLVCSAGTHQMGVDGDGTNHSCHASYWYNYRDYLENVDELVDWTEGRRIVDFDSSKFWTLTQPIISEFRDDYNYTRLTYLTNGFAENIPHRLNVALSMIILLAEGGQISPVFKENIDMAKLFAYFLILKSLCWANNQYLHGSMYTIPASLYRIYGNGFFEYLLEKNENMRRQSYGK